MKTKKHPLRIIFPNLFALGLFVIAIASVGLILTTETQTLIPALLALYSANEYRKETRRCGKCQHEHQK